MKKLLSVCVWLLILVSICTTCISAADSDKTCRIVGDFEKIVFRGKTYVPLDLEKAELLDGIDVTLSEEYENEEIHKKYKYSAVTFVEQYPHILSVDLLDTYDRYVFCYFVEESRVEDVQNFLDYKTHGHYTTESDYWDIEDFVIEEEDVYNWMASGEILTAPANKMEHCVSYPLYWEDPDIGLYTYIGDILVDYDEEGNEIFYLIYFPFYEANYFYASGSYAIESTLPTNFIRLTDEELTEELAVYYAAEPEDDELDWVVPGELPEGVLFAVTLILFGILPGALLIFAVVWLIVKQPKNPYFAALCVVIAAAAEIVIAYVALAMLLS